MAGTKYGNRKAKNNGDEIEENINILLQSLNLAVDKSIHEGIDFIINGKYVEVKSCQVVVGSSEKVAPARIRTGRFILKKEQHEELLKVDGYYMFVVAHNDIILDYRIIKSKHIRFRRVITWGTIWRNEYVFKTWMGRFTEELRYALSDNSI